MTILKTIACAVVLAATCLVTASTAHAQQRSLAYRLPGMETVQRIADQPYRSLSGTRDTVMYGQQLRFDVYLPARRSDERLPGVIFIHGGMVPDTQRISPKDDLPSYREWGRLVAAAGMIAITFSHRLTTEDNADVAFGDVQELLRTVRARASEWRLDPDRICVAVFSAGGPLSAPFIGDAAHRVRCIVLYYPFLDVEHTGVGSMFRRAHTPERVAELRRYSPREQLLSAKRSVPPIFLAKAGRDAIPGINSSIDRFVTAALWINAPLDLYIHPTGPHGFDMVVAPDARSAEIVAATVAFFQRHLR